MVYVVGGVTAPPAVALPQPQQQRLFLSSTEHATLDAKNLAALRTLFAIATRLALRLGDSWMLVLGTVNCVDCILATPRQAAQVQLPTVVFGKTVPASVWRLNVEGLVILNQVCIRG